MGVSLSTARYLAPASFFIDFVAQQYGMLSEQYPVFFIAYASTNP